MTPQEAIITLNLLFCMLRSEGIKEEKMAHIEYWYRCTCGAVYNTHKEASSCAIRHVKSEKWAVGRYKNVRIYENHAPNSAHGIRGAMREADLSDIIEIRKQQLAERSSLKLE